MIHFGLNHCANSSWYWIHQIIQYQPIFKYKIFHFLQILELTYSHNLSLPSLNQEIFKDHWSDLFGDKIKSVNDPLYSLGEIFHKLSFTNHFVIVLSDSFEKKVVNCRNESKNNKNIFQKTLFYCSITLRSQENHNINHTLKCTICLLVTIPAGIIYNGYNTF